MRLHKPMTTCRETVADWRLIYRIRSHYATYGLCQNGRKENRRKVLRYIMGHAHIDVTMDVYNHVSEMSRIESEITRLDSVAIS